MGAQAMDETPAQGFDATAAAQRLQALERALVEGLGIGQARVPGGLTVEFMTELGRLLRESGGVPPGR
jgi:hypothetical protein